MRISSAKVEHVAHPALFRLRYWAFSEAWVIKLAARVVSRSNRCAEGAGPARSAKRRLGGGSGVSGGVVAGGEGFSPGVKGDSVRAHERVRAAAGRVAVGAALFIAEVADAPGGELLDRVRLHALDFEEGPLDAASAHGVLAERAVGANHAAAGDQHRPGGLADRRSDRAHRLAVPAVPADPAGGP